MGFKADASALKPSMGLRDARSFMNGSPIVANLLALA